jgi:hypothetical protein
MSGSEVVTDPNLLLVRIINTGRRAVSEENFQGEPFRIMVDRKVRSVEIAEKSNPQMAAEVKWEGNEAQLQPALFKPGEWIALAILTDGKPTEQSVDSRSSGIAKPREYRPREYGEVAATLGACAGVLFWLGVVFLLMQLNKYVVREHFATQDDADAASGLALIVTTVLAVVVASWSNRLLKRRLGRRAEGMKVL